MKSSNRKIARMSHTRGAVILGNEIETLGRKLDSVRSVITTVHQDTWAGTFWRQVEAQLLRKLKFLAQGIA